MDIIRLSLVFFLFANCFFHVDANAKPAGVVAIFDDSTALLGLEHRIPVNPKYKPFDAWLDHGGKDEPGETEAQTALREFLEETGYYTFGEGSSYNIQLAHILEAEKNGAFVETENYRLYFVRINGEKPNIQTFRDNASLAWQNLGFNAHVEKSDWDYFDVKDLKEAAWNQGNLPGKKERLYGPMKTLLQQPIAQDFLENLIRYPNQQFVSAKLNSTGLPAKVEEAAGGKSIKVTTDHNANASYQLMRKQFPVREDDLIKIPYDVTVEPGGKISLGLLNSAKNGWYGQELILGEGTHKGIYKRRVPAGETETSLVFRNYHLGAAGQSTFTVNSVNIFKEKMLNSTGNTTQILKAVDGAIAVTTDNNANASYQLQSDRFPVTENNEIEIPYDITVEPGGKISLGFLNTAKNGWYGPELILEEGTHKGIYKRRVPAGEINTSLVFRNYHLGTPGQSTFRIDSFDIIKK